MLRASLLGSVLVLASGLSACAASGGGKNAATDPATEGDGGGRGNRGDGGASGGGDNSNSDNNSNGNGGDAGMSECKTTCVLDDCGFISDGCGGVVDCPSKCPEGMGCGIDPKRPNKCATPPSNCTPKKASEVCAGKCGAVSDGCSDVIECDASNGGVACSAEQICGGYGDDVRPNECVDGPSCTSADCATLGLSCGQVGDGCGKVRDCTAEVGGCSNGQVCGTGAQSNTCVDAPTCTPIPPATACAGTCGQTGDGCGKLIDCEATPATACPSGTTCGGGGTPGECGNATTGDGGTGTCTPLDPVAECAGKCGFVSNGCGVAYDCSKHGGQVCDANAGESCGGGGEPAKCGKPICVAKTQAEACPGADSFKSCGQVPNGCGQLIDCGGCLTDQICGIDKANICGVVPVCVPKDINVVCAGKCGSVADGCGHSYACTGANGGVSCTGNEYCGANAPNTCGVPPSTCTAKTCADLGHSCGLASDGCGKVINCWPGCSPTSTTCTGECGEAQACLADGTSGAQSCVTGTGGCVGSLCNSLPSCSPNALTKLTGTVVTPGRVQAGATINRVPVPNAVVYIPANPSATLPSIFEGVKAGNAASCGRCDDEKLVADGETILASAVTDHRGQFTLEGRIPVGSAFKLVVKAGKWRRVIQVPATVARACQSAPLTVEYTRLSKNSTDGLTGTQLPKIAISTGSVDEMECVFRNIGVDEGEFTVPSGTGRVHMYRSNGARMAGQTCSGNYAASGNSGTCSGKYNCGFLDPLCVFTGTQCSSSFNGNQTGCRAQSGCSWNPTQVSCSANNNAGCTSNFAGCSWQQSDVSVADTELFGSQATLNAYDLVVFDCEGGEDFEGDTPEGRVETYVNAGGRMFASHYSYVWIEGNGTLDESADWGVTSTDDSATGFVSLPTGTTARTGANPVKSLVFRDWLTYQGALAGTTAGQLTPPGTPQFTITDPRDRAGANVGAATDEWVYRNNSGAKVQQLSFNTPYDADEDDICGRVAYSGFHVTATDNSGDSAYFPGVCSNGELSTQEKVLVFMLFDLAACVSEGDPPTPPECTRKTAASCTVAQCGFLADGCGGVIDCAGCAPGFYCDGNACKPQECTPSDCAALGFNCGTHADGCDGIALGQGGVESCGTCSDNQLCGAGGPGICGSSACKPIPLSQACPDNWCGLVSDGCGDTYDCGECPPGEVCGGGGTNVCGPGSCSPIDIDVACKDKNCGLVSDGCGSTLDCGKCTLPDTCGGGGKPNVCGHPSCTPFTKMEACEGLECGFVSDGCGGAIDCGDCPDGRICGGGGPNLCGASCEPTDCTAEGAECGKIGDDCGGVLDCGPCPPNQVCGAAGPNKCGGGTCTPTSCEAVNAECGLIGDGCGKVKDCGECTVPGETCGGAGVPNECGKGDGGCKKLTCEGQGVECGAAGNGCGGLLDCGGCDPGFTCERGLCKPTPVLQ